MSLSNLTEEEFTIVRRVLVAAANGPYFPEWEFQTLFGLARIEVSAIASGTLDETRDEVRCAINNSFVNLLGYPHGQESRLQEDLGLPIARISEIFQKWRAEGAA